MERLQKIIANSGFCSRRKAEEYIQNGKVKVNGEVVKELGFRASYDMDIRIEDKPIQNKKEKEYYLLYKPEKVISSAKDEKKRKTVVDCIDTNTRIYPVGRLDYDTTGALILTNDGELANILMHPSHEVEKVYLAKINGILTPEEIGKIRNGVNIEGRIVKPTLLKVKKINNSTNTSMISIGITEGRNHIVKKIFAHFDYKVLKLKREKIAFLTLEGLQKGEYRKLSIKEVKRLFSYK